MISIRKALLGTVAVIFVAYEALMFYFIHIEKAQLGFNLHYSCIIAAAIFSWLTLIIELIGARAENHSVRKILFNPYNGNLIRIAMLFTLVADYYLVAINEAKELEGVTVFLGTQLFIFLHIMLNDENPRGRKANVITRLSLTVVTVITAYAILGESTDPLAIISVIYYSNLCANAIFAHRIGRGGIILTIGLILFALCDINVGLSGLNSIYDGGFPEGSLLYNLLHTDLDLIWIFYIPSQTLIPLTLLFCSKKEV